MNNIIRFKSTRSLGDATTDYDVSITPGTTVLDFCKEVSNRGEWGSVFLDNQFGETLIEFWGDGSLKESYSLDNIWCAEKKIKSVCANGGWGMMNYYIVLEDSE